MKAQGASILIALLLMSFLQDAYPQPQELHYRQQSAATQYAQQPDQAGAPPTSNQNQAPDPYAASPEEIIQQEKAARAQVEPAQQDQSNLPPFSIYFRGLDLEIHENKDERQAELRIPAPVNPRDLKTSDRRQFESVVDKIACLSDDERVVLGEQLRATPTTYKARKDFLFQWAQNFRPAHPCQAQKAVSTLEEYVPVFSKVDGDNADFTDQYGNVWHWASCAKLGRVSPFVNGGWNNKQQLVDQTTGKNGEKLRADLKAAMARLGAGAPMTDEQIDQYVDLLPNAAVDPVTPDAIWLNLGKDVQPGKFLRIPESCRNHPSATVEITTGPDAPFHVVSLGHCQNLALLPRRISAKAVTEVKRIDAGVPPPPAEGLPPIVAETPNRLQAEPVVPTVVPEMPICAECQGMLVQFENHRDDRGKKTKDWVLFLSLESTDAVFYNQTFKIEYLGKDGHHPDSKYDLDIAINPGGKTAVSKELKQEGVYAGYAEVLLPGKTDPVKCPFTAALKRTHRGWTGFILPFIAGAATALLICYLAGCFGGDSFPLLAPKTMPTPPVQPTTIGDRG